MYAGFAGSQGWDVISYTCASRSGAARYVFELVRHLASKSGKVTLICPKDFEFRADLEACPGVKIEAIPSELSGSGGKIGLVARLAWQALCGIRSVLVRRKPERLVHMNFPGLMAFALPAILLWKLMGITVVLTVHDVVPHRWLFPPALRSIESAILRSCYHATSYLIVHHVEAERQLVEKFHIATRKISVIPHGAFSLASEPIPLPQDGEGRRALLFGAIRENKGVHLAIRAVQQLRREGEQVELMICGFVLGSERPYWESCKELIASAPDGIIAVERYFSNMELYSLLASSHFLVLPYGCFNSQSGVAALAMSNGRPIVATRAGGLSNLLIEGITGILIAEPTVEHVKVGCLRYGNHSGAVAWRVDYRGSRCACVRITGEA